MINGRTLDILLRTLDGADAGLGPKAPSRIAALGATLAVGNRLQRPNILLGVDGRDLPEAVTDNAHSLPASSDSALQRPVADGPPTRLATAVTQSTIVHVEGRVGDAVNAEVAYAGPGVRPDASTALHLSGAAKFVDELIRGTGDDQPSPPIRGAQPLIGQGAPVVEAMARALQSDVAQSGLFYESHLAQWAMQKYPVADLAQEPQASMQLADAHSATTEAIAASLGDRGATSLQGVFQGAAALPLVRHQLDALETRQVAWEGEVWPGQSAHIQIAEDDDAATRQDAPAWRTRLALDLPMLGAVEATLSLRGNALQLQLHVADAGSMPALRATHRDLISALEQRSLSLVGFSIDHERSG